MKNLVLVRHAKSSLETETNDHDRVLSSRGAVDANAVSRNCQSVMSGADGIISSTATRAMQTAEIFSKNLSWPDGKIIFDPEMYTFEADNLTRFIRSLDNNYRHVILFGHNAAITNFVNKFGDAAIDNVPTCGVIAITFETDDWHSLSKGHNRKMIFPKNLKQ